MNDKKINELIKQVRLDVGLKQKDARKGIMGSATYSKVENGRKNISFEEVILILNNLQVSIEDFFMIYVQPTLTENARVKLKRLYSELPNENSLNDIFKLYSDLEAKYSDLTAAELCVYFDIKAIFHKDYPHIINCVTPLEQKHLLKRIKQATKNKMFDEDYKVVAQAVCDLEEKLILEVVRDVFPLDKDVFLTDKNKRYISNIFANSLSMLLAAKDYAGAKEVITIMKNHKYVYDDSYYYLSHLTYLEYLYLFLAENDIDSLQKVNDLIRAVRIIGDDISADKMNEEVKLLIEEKRQTGNSKRSILVSKK